MSKGQKLVNSQVHVNRAVWAMNIYKEDEIKESFGDKIKQKTYIKQEIQKAIKSLKIALKGYY